MNSFKQQRALRLYHAPVLPWRSGLSVPTPCLRVRACVLVLGVLRMTSYSSCCEDLLQAPGIYNIYTLRTDELAGCDRLHLTHAHKRIHTWSGRKVTHAIWTTPKHINISSSLLLRLPESVTRNAGVIQTVASRRFSVSASFYECMEKLLQP